jgi:hypothetical protein
MISRHAPLLALSVLSLAGLAADRPLVTAPLLARAPTVDGQWEPGEWDAAGGPGGFTALDGTLLPAQPDVRVAWDRQHLYVAAVLPLPAGETPVAAAKDHDGPVWDDDAFEVFLDPGGQPAAYYQFIVNAAGVRYEARNRDAGFAADWAARSSVQEDRWLVEISIPFGSLGVAAPSGEVTWRANFAWDRVTGGRGVGTWAPMVAGLHSPARFGSLVLSPQAPPVRLLGPLRQADSLRLQGAYGPWPQPLTARASLLPASGTTALARAETSGGLGAESLDLSLALPTSQGFPTPASYRLQAEVTAGNRTLWAMAVSCAVRAPLVVALERSWLTGRLDVHLTHESLSATPADLHARIELLAADGQRLAAGVLQDLSRPRAHTFEVGTLAPGDYTVVVTAQAPGRKGPFVQRLPVTRPARPEWLGSQAGLSNDVLPPWTPVQVQGSEASVWGRTYRFGSLPFPESVVTRGTEVLAAPVRLTGKLNGQPLAWAAGSCQVSESLPHAATLQTAVRTPGLVCRGTVRVEYDGMVRSDVALQPQGEIRIDELTLEIPVKPEYARYLYHWPGRWGSAYNAGALPDKGFSSAFKPFLWLGDEWRGLSWFCESERGFRNARPDEVIDIRREDGAVVLRVRLIDQPTSLTEAHQFTFGFQATPVKLMSPDVWDYRLHHGANYGLEDQPYAASATVTYPLAGHVDVRQGTFECWLRPHFNPAPDVDPKAPGRGALNRNLLDLKFANDTQVGFYWNIDDRSMRLYYRQGRAYPLLIGTRSQWQAGEWHHVAFTWGTTTRVYLDGQLVGEKALVGLLPGELDRGEIVLGASPCEMDIDEVRISAVARQAFDLSAPPVLDEQTLLLDRLDEGFSPAGRQRTRPARGQGGVVQGGVSAAGRFGKCLAVARSEKPLNRLDGLARTGVRALCFHEHWTDIEAYPKTSHGEKLHKLVQACHASGLQLLLYHGYLLSTIAPEWDDYHRDCLVWPQQGGYQREPEQMAYMVCYRSVWQDFIAHYLDQQMTEYGTDGVYLDGTSEPWGCQNLHHGCGWAKADGTLGKTYPIFSTREMMRRIYTIVLRHNPKGQVNVHQSTCMTIPTLAFATSYWDGEQFGSIDRGPKALEVLPLDAFRCEFMGHNWGVPAEFLCYDRPYTMREAMAFTLLHDVLVRGNLSAQEMLWAAMDRFGRRDAVWLPYWENAQYVQAEAPEVKVSLYNRPGRGLVAVVSNLGDKPMRTQVTLELDRLEQPIALRGEEVETGVPVTVSGNRFAVDIRALDYAVVWLQPL